MAAYTGRVRSAEQLGQMLAQARLIQGVSQRELASQLGLTQKAIFAMESEEPTKYALRLFAMLNALGATIEITMPRSNAEET